MEMQQFLQVLFNPEEYAGFAPNVYGTSSSHISNPGKFSRFVTINPLQKYRQRADENVSCYRNFLVELDSGTEEEQLEYVRSMEMPYSTVTSSGGKSLHFIICLTASLENETQWREYAKAILQVMNKADQSTKNPSRFTRLAGAVRENGNLQELLCLGTRYTLAELQEWLKSHNSAPVTPPRSAGFANLTSLKISNSTRMFLINGAKPGTVNNSCFAAALNLLETGHSVQYIEKQFLRLSQKLGYNYPEMLKTIKSAQKRAERATT